ncbi:MAG: DUF455 family protein [Candidatus Algichlamydia australiensis]|nr:DUF455 family protein [Chlamydiales bacterium]
MELRIWAERILSAKTLEEKLLTPEVLTDETPGPSLLFDKPSRPVGMEFSTRTKEDKLPPLHEHKSADNRAICLHRFCGHELLAVEIMAQALLAFPDAPKAFRKGLANTLKEEQEHVRIYCDRLKQMGVEFGSMPLYEHFWRQVRHLTSPIKYVSVMSLTFEMANLDFAPNYGKNFERFGDHESAELMAQILRDEIGHVSFGMQWLKRFKSKELSEWDAWRKALPEHLIPKRAKGHVYQINNRKKARVPDDWIENLALI